MKTQDKLRSDADAVRRGMPLGGVVVFLLIPWIGLKAGESEAPSELESLRILEDACVRVIGASKPAFVFIQGGSGFLISDDGYVLTNEHVVGGRSRLPVTLAGGRVFRADVVGHDPQGDVALLKLEGAKGLPHLSLGDSDELTVGQRIIALGDPFLIASTNLFLEESAPPTQFEPTASVGIVSALNRFSGDPGGGISYSDAIQVDVAVNRGNSGGPLLTLDGKVVGINGKIETRFVLGINTGVGYAIPSNQIKRFLPRLKAARGGVVLHGTIPGLRVADRVGNKSGLAVVDVIEDSPAAGAGFQEGDLLLSLAGYPVTTRTRYFGILGTYPAGEKVEAEVARGESKVSLTAVLVSSGKPYLGIQVAEHEAGLEIKSVGPQTPARRADLRMGDVITAFEGKRLTSSTQLAELIEDHDPGEIVTLSLLRDGKPVEIQVQLGRRPE